MANRNPSPSTRFKSGAEWTGNRKGRPPGRSLTAKLRALLDLTTWDGQPLPEGKTVADLVAEVFLRKALGGDFSCMTEVLNRTEGKVRDWVPDSTPVAFDWCPGVDKSPVADDSPRPIASLPEDLESNWKGKLDAVPLDSLKAAS